MTRKPQTSKSPWSTRADEVLADGLWHSGREFSLEVSKVILPGVARRLNERVRAAGARRYQGPTDRKIERGADTLIAMGKRVIIQTMVHARVRSHSWEVRPWPIPEQGWAANDWEVRDLRAIRVSLSVAALQVGISVHRLRELVLRDPPVPHEQVGRVIYLYDQVALAERAQEAKAESLQRRSEASRTTAAKRRTQPPTRLSLSQLGRRDNLSTKTVRSLAMDSPELDWQHWSRNSYLPIDELPKWDEVVAMYKADTFVRRSAAAKRSRAAQRERRAAPPQSP